MADIRINDHLIIPFGTAKKWDVSNVQLKYATTTGIYLETSVPCVYIDRAKQTPMLCAEARRYLGDEVWDASNADDDDQAGCLSAIQATIKQYMPAPTQYELKFLDLYFEEMAKAASFHTKHSSEKVRSERPYYRSWWSILLPVPEAQLYCPDPLEDEYRADPKHNFRVDFCFWDGAQLVGVEIDGWEPQGYAADVRRNRLLQRSGVELIHITNRELEQYGSRVIRKLLPERILKPWRFFLEKTPISDVIPF